MQVIQMSDHKQKRSWIVTEVENGYVVSTASDMDRFWVALNIVDVKKIIEELQRDAKPQSN
jgi:hypothetical protein